MRAVVYDSHSAKIARLGTSFRGVFELSYVHETDGTWTACGGLCASFHGRPGSGRLLFTGAQLARLQAYCEAMRPGEEVRVVVDEGVSAKSLDRPALNGLLADCRARRVSSVVVLKVDRLTRSVRDLADLLDLFEKSNVALCSLSESLDTSTASGRLMLNLLASVSQWEREAIAERTSFALAHAAVATFTALCRSVSNARGANQCALRSREEPLRTRAYLCSPDERRLRLRRLR